MTLDELFVGHDESRRLFDVLQTAVSSVGPSTLRVTKSQVAFRRVCAFAWAWRPGQYLAGKRPPLVLSIALRRRDDSKRWKEIVEPAPGRFMHHLELRKVQEIDSDVFLWLREAWSEAGGKN